MAMEYKTSIYKYTKMISKKKSHFSTNTIPPYVLITTSQPTVLRSTVKSIELIIKGVGGSTYKPLSFTNLNSEFLSRILAN